MNIYIYRERGTDPAWQDLYIADLDGHDVKGENNQVPSSLSLSLARSLCLALSLSFSLSRSLLFSCSLYLSLYLCLSISISVSLSQWVDLGWQRTVVATRQRLTDRTFNVTLPPYKFKVTSSSSLLYYSQAYIYIYIYIYVHTRIICKCFKRGPWY